VRTKSVYLAGSISGLTHAETQEYYAETTALLPDWLTPVSPMRDKDALKTGAVIDKAYEEHGHLYTGAGIFARDYSDVLRCDCVLANFARARKVSVGSMFELAWAWQLRKPTVIVLEAGGRFHDHPFVRQSTPFIYEDLRPAVECLKSIMREGV